MAQRRGLAGWQIATLTTAGAVGSLALANWLTRVGLREPEHGLSGATALYPWTEGAIHYAAAGRGEPLLLLHDLRPGASAYDYRKVFEPLARHYRVFAPDLLGYGRSGHPAISYTPALYVSLIEDFLRQVAGAADQPAHLVAAGRGAPFAVLAAAARPQLVRSLALIEPEGLARAAPRRWPGLTLAARALLRAPLVGEGLYNLAVSRRGLRQALGRRLAAGAPHASDDVIDQYYANAHQPGARFAPVDGLTMLDGAESDAAEAYATLPTPTLLLWGQRDPAHPIGQARALREARAGVAVRVFPTGAMPYAEAPDAFTQEITTWLWSAARV